MIEHRLIERIIPLLQNELDRIGRSATPDPTFLDSIVDFIRTYADRCHHGKEEDILFRDLEKKTLSQEHKATLDELVKEHMLARKLTSQLAIANNAFSLGNKESLDSIRENSQGLIQLYPIHIEREDRHFFIPCLEYFTKQEQDLMLQEFYEFDRRLIHDRYRKTIENLEQRRTTDTDAQSRYGQSERKR